MRPSSYFAILVLLLLAAALTITVHGHQRRQQVMDASIVHDSLTRELGLSDLCLATEARYTRHPSVTDEIAPFMDYPAAQEHFPTGLFWAAPR